MVNNSLIKRRTEYENKYEELRGQFLAMGQLKSNFDMEKFTVATQGNFIAHQYHFLMRQYSLALRELRTLMLDLEEKHRIYESYANGETPHGKYQDLEMARTQVDIDRIELTAINKLAMCNYFEKLRVVLIEKNGGEITNAQYQQEVPYYWEWYLQCVAVDEAKQAETGIHSGTWRAIKHLEAEAPMTPEFQIPMLDDKTGMFDLNEAQLNINQRIGLDNRVKIIREVINKSQ